MLDYQRERSMVSFLTINAEQLSAEEQLFLQVQSIATASLNVQMTPEWRLQSQGKLNEENTQLPESPTLHYARNRSTKACAT